MALPGRRCKYSTNHNHNHNMKTYLLIALLLLSTASFSQMRDSTAFKAGAELIKFERQHSTGIVLQVIGGGLVGVGAASSANNPSVSKPLVIGGSVLAFIGLVTQLTSATHIKKAGLILQGNTLIIPLKKRRR